MLCQDVIEALEAHSPVCYAESWDNVGLLAGRRNKEVKKIMVALDATDEVVKQAVDRKADMLITHHPLIFKAQKTITMDSLIGRRLVSMIQADISYYAMHTNFDIIGMAKMSADKLELINQDVLEVTSTGEAGEKEGLGRVGTLPKPMNLTELAEHVKKCYELDYVLVSGNREEKFMRIGVCTGSGKSTIPAAITSGVQVLVTGDMDHHTVLDAVADGLAIIDAGHYGTEKMFVPYIKDFLQKKYKEICVVEAKEKNPFYIV